MSEESTSQPLLSIITVHFDDLARLSLTLSSLLSIPDWIEHIVVDGGSPEPPHSIVRSSGTASRLVVQDDAGIYDAMNKAVSAAKGRWIFFLNCGDLLSPDCDLSLLASTLSSASNSIFYFSVKDYKSGRLYLPRPIRGPLLMFKFLKRRVCHQAVIMERVFLLRYSFNLNWTYHADQELIVSLLEGGVPLIPVYDNLLCLIDDAGYCAANKSLFQAEEKRFIRHNSKLYFYLRIFLSFFKTLLFRVFKVP